VLRWYAVVIIYFSVNNTVLFVQFITTPLPHMENESFLNKIPDQTGQSASVKNVFGEPIHAGDTVIIPVAHIAYGFGGGFGKGKKEYSAAQKDDHQDVNGEGGGGGGGVFARAKGVYVIRPHSAKYIPASNTKPILLGIGIGLLLKGLFTRRKKKLF
jgi:uncharacterized spore protein YtfJ